MPTTFYTEQEFKSSELKFTAAIGALKQIADQQSALIKEVEYAERKRNRLKTGRANLRPEKYPYIPIDLNAFLVSLDIVRALLKKQNKEHNIEDYERFLKFVDAGCGYPITLMLASRYKFDAVGYELDDKVFEASKLLNANIKKQDILTANYHTFDVVYYYCPFEDTVLEEQLEAKIEAEMKVGAYLMAALKRGKAPSKKNFRLVNSNREIIIWEKIK